MNYSPQDGFPYYFNLVGDEDCHELFSSKSTFSLLNSINEEQAKSRYSPDKWSIKQVLGHITDHERIMILRAFLLSRNQQAELWGYDQNSLVDNSSFEELTFKELIKDFECVRGASISLIKGLSESQLKIKGKARQYDVELQEFLKSIIGHEKHHINILKERYLMRGNDENEA